MTLPKVPDETSAEFNKLRSECNSAAVRHHELLASIRRLVKACEECNDKVADTIV